MLDWIQALDIRLLTGIMGGHSSLFLDKFMVLVSTLGDGGFCWLALGIIFLIMGNKKRPWRSWGCILLLCLGVNALVCNLALKPLVGRMRPYDLMGFEILVERLSDASFPSGHTSASFAAAAALYHINQRWGIAAILFATLMGFSRLYLGVHFPTDVLAGAVLGWFVAKGVIYFIKRCNFKNKGSIL